MSFWHVFKIDYKIMYHTQLKTFDFAELKFSFAWSCVPLTRSTTLSEWKLLKFDKVEVKDSENLLIYITWPPVKIPIRRYWCFNQSIQNFYILSGPSLKAQPSSIYTSRKHVSLSWNVGLHLFTYLGGGGLRLRILFFIRHRSFDLVPQINFPCSNEHVAEQKIESVIRNILDTSQQWFCKFEHNKLL